MLTLYGHPVSQPSRAVIWLLEIERIPFKLVEVNPLKGEASTDEYLAKFSAGGIPGLEVPAELASTGEPLHLTEGAAILQYLCESRRLEKWYKSSPEARAKVAQWMHWLHTSLRLCSMHMFRPELMKYVGGTPVADPRQEKVWSTFTAMPRAQLYSRPPVGPGVFARMSRTFEPLPKHKHTQCSSLAKIAKPRSYHPTREERMRFDTLGYMTTRCSLLPTATIQALRRACHDVFDGKIDTSAP